MDLECVEHLEEQVAELKMQNELINNMLVNLINKLDQLMALPVHQPNSSTVLVQKTSHVKLSPPQEFSGDCMKGQVFLNSCELYLQLAPQQFALEHKKVSWAYSFMKSECVALFINYMLCSETLNNKVQYATWMEFQKVFQKEFCQKNETQLALAKFETLTY